MLITSMVKAQTFDFKCPFPEGFFYPENIPTWAMPSTYGLGDDWTNIIAFNYYGVDIPYIWMPEDIPLTMVLFENVSRELRIEYISHYALDIPGDAYKTADDNWSLSTFASDGGSVGGPLEPLELLELYNYGILTTAWGSSGGGIIENELDIDYNNDGDQVDELQTAFWDYTDGSRKWGYRLREDNTVTITDGLYNCEGCRNNGDVFINIVNGEVYEYYRFEATNTCPSCGPTYWNPDELHYTEGPQNINSISIISSTTLDFNINISSLFIGRATLTNLNIIDHIEDITNKGNSLLYTSSGDVPDDGIYSVVQQRNSNVNENDLANTFFYPIGQNGGYNEYYFEIEDGEIIGRSTAYQNSTSYDVYDDLGSNVTIEHLVKYQGTQVSLFTKTARNCYYNHCYSFGVEYLNQYIMNKTAMTTLPGK